MMVYVGIQFSSIIYIYIIYTSATKNAVRPYSTHAALRDLNPNVLVAKTACGLWNINAYNGHAMGIYNHQHEGTI